MDRGLEKITTLIAKTGDRCIVLDAAGNPAYVIMRLADYEKMVVGTADVSGLSEDELLEKINRDIALWRTGQDSQDFSLNEPLFNPNIQSDSLGDIEENKLNQAKKTVESPAYEFEPIE